MKSIIEYIFLPEIKAMENVKLQRQLIQIESNIIGRLESQKLTRQFINELIGMYDKEHLYKIMALIQKEIHTRTRKELNNEI